MLMHVRPYLVRSTEPLPSARRPSLRTRWREPEATPPLDVFTCVRLLRDTLFRPAPSPRYMRARHAIPAVALAGSLLLLSTKPSWPLDAASKPSFSSVSIGAPAPPPQTSHSDDKESTMHVVLAADAPHWPGVAGVIKSARHHASTPLHFHLIIQPLQEAGVRHALECHGACGTATTVAAIACVSVVLLPSSWLAGRIRVVADPKTTGPLCSPLNFARFYLPQLLPPTLRRVLYLDADMIVQSDLKQLWGVPMPIDHLVAAVPRDEPHFRYSRYAKKCGGLYAARYPGEVLNSSAPSFNAGLMLVDLDRWRAANRTREAEWWMAEHAASDDGLWALGSQPVLHLILHGRWAPLPARWNLDGCGRVPNMPSAKMRAANSLHWTGRRKPWRSDGLYKEFYRPFVTDEEVRRCSVSPSAR